MNIKKVEQPESHSDLQTAILILAFLITTFNITYSGQFASDDEHLLASRSLSLAFDESLGSTRVYGNSRQFALTNTSEPYAAQAENIEPGQMLIGSLFARGAALLDIGQVQALFLVNIWTTALTGVIIFITVRKMGYARRTATWTAILFGIGSIAWPYSRTYFRDSLAMMFLAIAHACSVVISQKIWAQRSRLLKGMIWFLLFASLGAGILTKNTIVIAVPVLLGYIIYSRIRADSWVTLIHRLKNKKGVILLGAGVLLMVLWIGFLIPTGIFARFSLEYYQLIVKKFFISPHPDLLEALLGPLISPGKSIFLYSPVLVISMIGLFKQMKTAWPGWAYLSLLILGQALFYGDSWWGHINWGLRFSLPAIPILMVSAASVVDRWLSTQKGRVTLLGMAMISILVQFMGILPPLSEYYQFLYNSSLHITERMAIWDPQYSAILWSARWIFRGGDWNLAVIQQAGGFSLFVIGMFIIGFIARITKLSAIWPAISVLGVSMFMSILMLFTYKDDPNYYSFRNDLTASHQVVSDGVLPEDLVLIKSYGTPIWHYWMNWADPKILWTALPYYFPPVESIEEYYTYQDPEVAMDEITLSLFRNIPENYNCVWLLIAGDSPGATLNIEVSWLERQSFSYTYWEFKDNDNETRLYLFNLTSDPCG